MANGFFHNENHFQESNVTSAFGTDAAGFIGIRFQTPFGERFGWLYFDYTRRERKCRDFLPHRKPYRALPHPVLARDCRPDDCPENSASHPRYR